MSLWEKLFGDKKSPKADTAESESIQSSATSNPQSSSVRPTPVSSPQSEHSQANAIGTGNQSASTAEASTSSVTADDNDVDRSIKELWDKKLDVRINAAKNLGDILAGNAASKVKGPKDTEAALALYHVIGCVTDRSVQHAASEAIDRIKAARLNAQDNEVDRLLVWLEDWKADTWKTIDALVNIGAPAVEPLCKTLENARMAHRSRASAAHALGRIGDVRSLESLCAALWDREPDVRASAAHALLKIGDSRGVEAIYRALEDTKGDTAIEAAEAVGKIGDARAVESLCKALGHVDWRVRKSAVEALVKVGAPTRTDRNRACDAYPAYKVIGDDAKNPLSGSTRVLICDARVVESLYRALGDANSDVRRNAGEALAKIGAPAARPASWDS